MKALPPRSAVSPSDGAAGGTGDTGEGGPAPPVWLVPFLFWLSPAAGPLLPQLRNALTREAEGRAGAGAEPLRWAITAVDPQQGLLLEGVILAAGPEPESSPDAV